MGQTLTIGLGFDHLLVEMASAQFGYKSRYQPDDTTNIVVEPQVAENRLGVFFREERDLAGFLLGGGVTQYQESIDLQGTNYTQSGNQIYLKAGLVLIFGSIQVRADQVQTKLGELLLQTSSVGVVMRF